LDLVFTRDINGNLNSGSNTTETFRYATLNGLKVALPTYGGPVSGGYAQPSAGFNGNEVNTSYDVGTTTTAARDSVFDSNATYNDWLAIWDAHSTATSVNGNGTPPGWVTGWYLTATQSSSGGQSLTAAHAAVNPNPGSVNSMLDTTDIFAALQVLNPATFTSASYVNQVDTFRFSGSDFLSLGNVGADIKSYVSFGYDTDGNGQADLTFNASDFTSARVMSDSSLEVVLNASGVSKLEDNADFDTAIAAVGGADKVILAANAANNFSNAATLNVTQFFVGQSVIDLGVGNGKLIAPVQVEGKWYYFWDRNGDGTNSGDRVDHNTLDSLFNKDINGVVNTSVTNNDGAFGTTDVYRYATINGVKLALPTANGGMGYPQGMNALQRSTSYNDANGLNVPSNGTSSGTFDDLLAIWDAFNGSGSFISSSNNGTPAGWQTNSYWSATPSFSGHAIIDFLQGGVGSLGDTSNSDSLGQGIHVALQVLG
jgi:hypothetical protein